MGELERIVASAGDRLDVQVIFFKPARRPESWALAGLWRRVARVPGVRARIDDDGVEASRFGVRTSGQVLLYDVGGRLRFSGGITTARGHMGDGPGRDAILAIAGGDRTLVADTPVFGCAIRDPERAVASKESP